MKYAILFLVPLALACQMPGGTSNVPVQPATNLAEVSETQGANPHNATSSAVTNWNMASQSTPAALMAIVEALGATFSTWTPEQVTALTASFAGMGAPQTVSVTAGGGIENTSSSETGGAAIGRSSLPVPGTLEPDPE